jgi:hypothetical protein
MTATENRVAISRIAIGQKEFFKFTFNGLLTHKAAKEAATVWREAFQLLGNTKTNIVFDCLHMTNYEPMARSLWQSLMLEHKRQINEIWVLTDSKLIQAGAAIMGVFTSFNIKTASSEEKLAA